ncbi:MAG TPA: hypothetical protein EYN34_05295 [Aquifex sp.]|nr:hypothetical protein [Aquifex sp.]
MGHIIELLDQLEETLKGALPEDKAKKVKKLISEIGEEISKETLEKQIPLLEERLSSTLATKEDIRNLEKDIHKLEKEILTLKLLLWIVIILTGLSSFPQILNLLKLMK